MDIARKTALSALNRIFGDGSYSNITVDKLFTENTLDKKDRAFATRIVYGVLDRKITLDFVLDGYLKKGVSKTSLYTLNAMRMALYQIMFMDKVPDSAAVNESVNLVKKSKESYNAALVNGVLRNVLRNGVNLPDGNDIKSLSVRYSCPEEIIDGFVRDYGFDTAKSLLEEMLKAPKVSLRVNTLKTSPDELIALLNGEGVAASIGNTENSLTVDGGIDIKSLKTYKDGLFHVEDEACQRAVSVLSLENGARVLDMCAAPGGKSFTVAQNGDGIQVLSCDIYEKKIELIKTGAKRLGLLNVKTALCDATKKYELGLFDAVICDVPCSGLGVLRRKPEIKYKENFDFCDLCDIQARILMNADNYIKRGGALLYSTCTLRKAENELQVRAFLDKHTDYALKYEHTFMPHIDGTDGFYCALLVKSR